MAPVAAVNLAGGPPEPAVVPGGAVVEQAALVAVELEREALAPQRPADTGGAVGLAVVLEPVGQGQERDGVAGRLLQGVIEAGERVDLGHGGPSSDRASGRPDCTAQRSIDEPVCLPPRPTVSQQRRQEPGPMDQTMREMEERLQPRHWRVVRRRPSDSESQAWWLEKRGPLSGRIVILEFWGERDGRYVNVSQLVVRPCVPPTNSPGVEVRTSS